MAKTILGVNGIRLIGRLGGVGRVIEAILGCMDRVDHPFDEIRVYSPEPIPAAVKLPACATNIVAPSRLPPGLWEQVTLPRVHGARHLLLCPSYVAPLAARCPILLIHHGSYEGVPIQYSRWRMLKARLAYQSSCWKAQAVATVSEHSKEKIKRYYHIADEKISVIPNGVDLRLFRPMSDRGAVEDWRRERLGGEAPFILYVGRMDQRRSIPNLVAAFARARREDRLPLKLVLIGTAFQRVPLASIIARSGVAEDIVCIPYASHEEIALAYNACEMAIYPSLYEGFGMPVLEAMACGRPVIAMNNTAFPEFAGGVAELLPDAQIETLRAAITSLHDDPERRSRMSAKGVARAQGYDWPVITAMYIDLMRRTLAATRRHAM